MPDRSYLPLKTEIFRPRVDRLIRTGFTYPLMTVIAGVGYGKSTALASSVNKISAKLIWLKLLNIDNEPGRFWSRFLQAADVEMHQLVYQLSGVEFPESMAAFGSFIQTFGECTRQEKRVILVFDDYGDLHNQSVKEFIENILYSELDNLCMVLISNSKSGINPLGMKHGGNLFHVNEQDLCFTKEEIALYFQEHQIELTGEKCQQLQMETEGWPLALYFIQLQYQKDKLAYTKTSHSELVAELFENEFYRRYDPVVQHLLVELSLFHAFPVDFFELIAGEKSQDVIDIVVNHMFIVYDYRERMFIFQNMYRNFLSHKQAFISAERRREIRLIGGEWFVQHRHMAEAVGCFWEIHEYGRFIDLLFQLSMQRMSRDICRYILSLLIQIPLEYRQANPTVDFCRGYYYLSLMDTRQAQVIFEELLDQLKDQFVENRRMIGEIYMVLSDIYRIHNKAEFVDLARKAREHLNGPCLCRNKKTMLIGNDDVFFLHHDGPGALAEIRAMVFEYVTYIEPISNGCATGYEFLFAAECDFNIGEFERSRENAYQAIFKARKYEQHDIICNSYFVLLRIAFTLGNYQVAREILDKLSAYIKSEERNQLIEFYDCIQGWLEIKLNRPEDVAPWIKEGTGERFTDLPLGQGRSRILGAYYYIARNQYPKALALLVQTECILQDMGICAMRLVILIMKAICYQKNGLEREALEAFQTACNYTCQNRIIMPFVQFGSTLRPVIRLAKADSTNSFDQKFLDLIDHWAEVYARRNAAMIKLHKKESGERTVSTTALNKNERLILSYMAEGMTRQEIAELEKVSINTLKKRITVIYNKLGAANKSEAIRIASMRGELIFED